MLLRLAVLASLAVPPAFAGSWSGILVGSSCYATEQRNVTKFFPTGEQDLNMQVRACTPKPQTRAFTLLLSDGGTLNLDSAGNAKAAELVRNTAKRPMLHVIIIGNVEKHTLQASSIATTD